MTDLLDSIVRYWQWADNSAWEIVKELTEEEFNHNFGELGHSLRIRYIHLAEDSWEWYADWTGAEISEEPDFDALSKEELFSFITLYNEKWANLLSHERTKSINVGQGDTMVTITLPEILFHMNNHAAYHRGQIMLSLRLLGKDTHMTDYVPFRIKTGTD
ncbi:MAG: hypothetical protein KAR33_11340 [Candidatus Thorarchaeota archaeon]|nr:hypothetical protein [Candidatus Thorarchaeota archaeon]